MLNILVAGPDSVHLARLVEHLARLDHRVTRAYDSTEIEHSIQGRDTDVVCLSPHIDDLDYAAFLSVENREVLLPGYLPVLIIAEDSIDAVRIYQEMGADEIISPYHSPRLIRTRIETTYGLRWIKMRQSPQPVGIAEYLEFAHNVEQFVLPMGFHFIRKTNMNRLLELIANAAQSIAFADGATMYLREGDLLRFAYLRTDSLQVVMGGTSGVPIPFEPLPLLLPDGSENHQHMAAHAVNTGKALHVPDIYAATGFDFTASRRFDAQSGYRTTSCLTVPFQDHSNQSVAVLQLINARDLRGNVIPFQPNDVLAIEGLGTQAAIAITNLLLYEERSKLIKLENEIRVGRTVQASFLPNALPTIDGYGVAAEFRPAREVSGDFYDVFRIGSNLLGLVIADVCDKGVPAALYMALTRSLLRASLDWMSVTAASSNGHSARRMTEILAGLPWTNRYLVEQHADLIMFATMFFAVLNTETGQIAYINAGHSPPYVLRDGVLAESLQPTGPAIGVVIDEHFGIAHTQLHPGDTLLAFTDGVPEARNAAGDFFGELRLQDLMESASAQGATVDQTLAWLMAALSGHIGDAAPYDDITLLAVQRNHAD